MSVEKSRISLIGKEYCVFGDLELALEVALTTGRPLLLFGDPGSGKSSFAMWAAHKEKRRYYEYVVTARTQPQDLLWSFDSIRRLSDATAGKKELSPSDYIRPGVLWWAFDRDKAEKFDKDFGRSEPDSEWNKEHANSPAVVLIDEIDKADPDLPNSLLVPLGNRYFAVADLEKDNEVRENSDRCSLIVVTTNDERELPRPFIRRCVVFRLRNHEKGDLKKISEKHFPDLTTEQELSMLEKLIDKFLEEQKMAINERRRAPSTAEFLDAVRACREHRYHLYGRLDAVLDMLYVKQANRSRQ